MSQEILNWILGIATSLITSIIALGFTLLTKWLLSKIKNEKTSRLITNILLIIEDSVMEIFQCSVEALKKEGKFNSAAQKKAKETALEVINNKLTPEMRVFIETNYGDIKAWLSTKIEATIYALKN